ncbi:hypothetical protein FA95DRAFT_1180362 [Auriscalpium vulgare]|uniref:Uncharacterized protein n=1 Tax=Auriscalpium vulgare TaxID=40419 RepID=A0ACB8S9K8_9AGAM|nr:hypothetical protein FA95DRAFT_1180362 [Auriscalpium vulgare]
MVQTPRVSSASPSLVKETESHAESGTTSQAPSSAPTSASVTEKLSQSSVQSSASVRTSSSAASVSPSPSKGSSSPTSKLLASSVSSKPADTPSAPAATSQPSHVVNSPPVVSSEAGLSSSVSSPASFTGADGRLQGPQSLSTSTVTLHPESTFATPVSIPVTVSGHVTISAPPFITSLGVSTLPDGESVTITHIIANPTDSLNALGHHSFFDNHGAVIGVFLAAGIAVACLAVVSFCVCRRRRRRINGHRLNDRSPTLPAYPFVDSPERAMFEHGPSGVQWDNSRFVQGRTRNDSLLSMPQQAYTAPSSQDALQIAGLGAAGRSRVRDSYEGPFSEYHRRRVAISPLDQAFAALADEQPSYSRAASRAQSSPSIYPPSLPDERADSPTRQQLQETYPPLPVTRPQTVRPPSPPTPPGGPEEHVNPFSDAAALRRGPPLVMPKSPLRPPSKPLYYEHMPTTPTTSNSSHNRNSPFESPTSEAGSGLTSILDERVYRTLPTLPETLPEAPPAPEAFLRRTFSKRLPLNVRRFHLPG